MESFPKSFGITGEPFGRRPFGDLRRPVFELRRASDDLRRLSVGLRRVSGQLRRQKPACDGLVRGCDARKWAKTANSPLPIGKNRERIAGPSDRGPSLTLGGWRVLPAIILDGQSQAGFVSVGGGERNWLRNLGDGRRMDVVLLRIWILGIVHTPMYFATMIGLAALGVWVLFTSRDLIRQALASYRWLTTEGVIVDLSDDSFITPGLNRTDSGIVDVTWKELTHIYEYQVDGQTYRSSTYCFGAHIERAEATFQVSSKVKVYYDPHDPKNAVLRRGLQPSMFFGPALLAAALYIGIDLFCRK